MARFARGDEHLELVRDGCTIIEGTALGEARRALHDERAALIAYYTRIAELLDDRWHRTTPFVADLVTTEEPALVAAIDAGDPDALAVYTDWLLDRGDPRGELAALRAAEPLDARQIASLEKTRGVELFGPLAMLGRGWRDDAAFMWRRGWIDEITLQHAGAARVPPGELMHHVLHAPMARFARALTLDHWYARTLHECIAPCACTDRIRALRLRDRGCDRALLAALPALEELELLDDDWVPIGHPRVRRLRLTVDVGGPQLEGEWPSLVRLELVTRRTIGLLRCVHALLSPPPATLRELMIDATIERTEVAGNIVARVEDLRPHFDRFELTIREA